MPVGGWIKLHNEELRNLHSSPYIVPMNSSGGGGGGWRDIWCAWEIQGDSVLPFIILRICCVTIKK
jgi:hypothetical protein